MTDIHIDGNEVDLSGLELNQEVEFTIKGTINSLRAPNPEYEDSGGVGISVSSIQKISSDPVRIEATQKFAI